MMRMTIEEMAAAWIDYMELAARVAAKIADRMKAEEDAAWAASESHWSSLTHQRWLRAATRNSERQMAAGRARMRADNVTAMLADYRCIQPVRRSA